MRAIIESQTRDHASSQRFVAIVRQIESSLIGCGRNITLRFLRISEFTTARMPPLLRLSLFEVQTGLLSGRGIQWSGLHLSFSPVTADLGHLATALVQRHWPQSQKHTGGSGHHLTPSWRRSLAESSNDTHPLRPTKCEPAHPTAGNVLV